MYSQKASSTIDDYPSSCHLDATTCEALMIDATLSTRLQQQYLFVKLQFHCVKHNIYFTNLLSSCWCWHIRSKVKESANSCNQSTVWSIGTTLSFTSIHYDLVLSREPQQSTAVIILCVDVKLDLISARLETIGLIESIGQIIDREWTS